MVRVLLSLFDELDREFYSFCEKLDKVIARVDHELEQQYYKTEEDFKAYKNALKIKFKIIDEKGNTELKDVCSKMDYEKETKALRIKYG